MINIWFIVDAWHLAKIFNGQIWQWWEASESTSNTSSFFDMNQILVEVAVRVANLQYDILSRHLLLVRFYLVVSGRVLFVPLARLVLLNERSISVFFLLVDPFKLWQHQAITGVFLMTDWRYKFIITLRGLIRCPINCSVTIYRKVLRRWSWGWSNWTTYYFKDVRKDVRKNVISTWRTLADARHLDYFRAPCPWMYVEWFGPRGDW